MRNENISKADAQVALHEIEQVIRRTQKAIAAGPAAPLFILWGVIWAIGYSFSYFTPAITGPIWGVLVLVGALSSWCLGVKMQSSVQSPNDWKIGAFWLVLFGYATAWLFLLAPADLHSGQQVTRGSALTGNQVGAFFATVPMFAYVVGGLWFGRFFVGLGLLVTVLTFGGYILLPEHFNLWMAVTGGGSLIAAGVYVRKAWR